MSNEVEVNRLSELVRKLQLEVEIERKRKSLLQREVEIERLEKDIERKANFLSLEKSCTFIHIAVFAITDVVSFDREDDCNVGAECDKYEDISSINTVEPTFAPYGATRKGATTGTVVADESSTSRSSKKKDPNVATALDIFGNRRGYESAHLIPHAMDCSKFWFPFVSWVLPIKSVNFAVNPDVNYLQNCINGFNGLKEADSSKPMNVGIKHFKTNRINVLTQRWLDDYPRVLIIPILENQQVRNWDGAGYNAIVLVNEAKSKVDTPASQVYEEFGAARINKENGVDWKSCLATASELETALRLLRESTLSFLYSLTTVDIKNELKNIIRLPQDDRLGTKAVNEEKCQEWKKLVNSLKGREIYVPGYVQPNLLENSWYDGYLNVRKISFSNEFNGIEPPDPALLLPKTISNFLNQQNMIVLPGCGSIDQNEEESENSKVFGYYRNLEIKGEPCDDPVSDYDDDSEE